MTRIDRKSHFIGELKKHYQAIISGAHEAEVNAAEAAEAIQRDATQREDAKAATSSARMSSAHRKRRERAAREAEELVRFAARGVRPFARDAKVELGALVDVRIQADGEEEERTLFFLPVFKLSLNTDL